MFDDHQRQAVRAAFARVGVTAPLRVLPHNTERELCFVLAQADYEQVLADVPEIERLIGQITKRTVFALMTNGDDDRAVPFDTL